ncbi:helix-turn-helix domain-containing protein [Actinoplanes sp. NPDC051633]|uniref:TetR/AcrR family transcriptional regulator n=1 Tax=Actinoplanes sp. NPDC051633 TaxID=3155670 RepID=UPI003441FE00
MTDPKAAPAPLAARAEQVRATRQRVLTAARDLFLRRGYAGTTIEAIAHRAKVSPQTVYNVIGGKAAVLKAVYDVTLAGDDEPVPMQERPIFAEIAAAPDARTALGLYAGLARDLLSRAGPLLAIIITEGPGRDRELRSFIDKTESERAMGTRGMARDIATRFGLPPGITEEEAADVLWTLTSPEVADRLTRRRGWSLDRYERWLAKAMADALR